MEHQENEAERAAAAAIRRLAEKRIRPVPPKHSARMSDLMEMNVEARCVCRRTTPVDMIALTKLRGIHGSDFVRDVEMRFRCQGCGAKGGASLVYSWPEL